MLDFIFIYFAVKCQVIGSWALLSVAILGFFMSGLFGETLYAEELVMPIV